MNIYREINRFVREVCKSDRVVRFGEGSLLALNIVAIFILLGWGTEIIASRFPPAPLVFSILFAASLSFAAAHLIAATLRRSDRDGLILLVEEKNPQLGNNLINSVRLHDSLERHGNQENLSLPLIEQLYDDTARQLHSIRPGGIIERSALKHSAIILSFLLLALTVSVSLNPGFAGRSLALLIHPMESLPLGETYIEMAPRGGYTARGEDVVLKAFTSGRIPDEVGLLLWEDSGPRSALKMAPAGTGKFRSVVRGVDKSFSYQARSGTFSSPQYRLAVVDPPLVGNLRIEYSYPEYTRLPPRVQSGSGHILAYRGTEVRLTADVNKEVTEGKIVFQDGAQTPLRVMEGPSVRGSMFVLKNGEYRIEVKEKHGFKNRSPVRYPIQVIPDELPRVEISAPAEDVEVDRNSQLNLSYSAGDDFGITAIALTYRIAGKENGEEEEIIIEKPQEGTKSVSNTYRWDLSSLRLMPGDEVDYRIKVQDNDNVSGPKWGATPTFHITIKGYEKEHQELEAKIEEMNDDLLNLLGDQLELLEKAERLGDREEQKASPSELQMLNHMGNKVKEEADDILQKLEGTLNAMERDPLMDSSTYFDLRSLQEALEYTANNLMKEARSAIMGSREPSPDYPPEGRPQEGSPLEVYAEKQERTTEELEKIASFADEISQNQRLHDLANQAKRLLQEQNALLNALDQLQEGGDIAAADEELNRLREMISGMLDALASLSDSMPNEFLNSQAMETLDFGNLQEGLDDIKEMLRKGDLEGAREAARKLLASLSRMMASLQNMRNMAGKNMMSFQSATESSGRIFDELIKEQKDILQETVQVDDASADRTNKEKEKNRDVLVSRANEALRGVEDLVDRLAGKLQRSQRDRGTMRELTSMKMGLINMKRGLYRKELEGLDRLVEGLEEKFSNLEDRMSEGADRSSRGDEMEEMKRTFKRSLEALREISREVSQFSRRETALLPSEKDKLSALAGDQGKLQDQAQVLAGSLRDLSAAAPSIGPEISDNLDRAVEQMGSATEELGAMEPHSAASSEREALYRLTKAQEALDRAGEQMARKRQMAGMSMPTIIRGGSPMSPGSQNEMALGEWGRTGHSKRDFTLPSKEDYTVPPEYREEISKALKEGYPPEFKEMLEKYYKNISE